MCFDIKKKENNFYYNFGADGDRALNISYFKGQKKLNMDELKFLNSH